MGESTTRGREWEKKGGSVSVPRHLHRTCCLFCGSSLDDLGGGWNILFCCALSRIGVSGTEVSASRVDNGIE